MKTIYLNQITEENRKVLCKRPGISYKTVFPVVQNVIDEVKQDGDMALRKFTKKFDQVDVVKTFKVSEKEINEANNNVSKIFQKAIDEAYKNISTFHKSQLIKEPVIETVPGVRCWRENRAIENVGLYVPGGTAIYSSTFLMLATPAKIAGCKNIYVCSPPQERLDGKVAPEVLYIAKLLGLNAVYKVGGAQAIAAMGFGTESIPKADKIFGPGNQYVTAAKMLVSIDPNGCPLDLPAGPTEVFIIADENANPAFLAADLLSQAEHGADSQVILATTSESLTDDVKKELEKQKKSLPRVDYIDQCLQKSMILIVDNLDQAMEFSNEYAPEHLIINTRNAKDFATKTQNAGSVFLGPYSPESAGDYASGTNHSLPTYGYAKNYSGTSVDSFIKKITFQEISKDGLKNLQFPIETLARSEGLTAHARAASIRFEEK